MVITCPACEARYRLNRDKIQGRGAKITCPKCAHVFVVFNEEEEDGASRAAQAKKGRETTTGAFNAVLGGDEENVVPTTTGKIRVVAPGKRGSRRTVATVDSGSFDSAPKAADLSEHIPIEAVEAEPEAPDEPNLRASDLNFREVGINTWKVKVAIGLIYDCLLYTSPSPRDATLSRMPSSA